MAESRLPRVRYVQGFAGRLWAGKDIIMQKKSWIFCFLFCISSCCGQKNEQKSIKNQNTYAEKFIEVFHDTKLYIGCIVFNELRSYESTKIFTENDAFITIAGKIQSRDRNSNIDSLVEHYAGVNGVNFYSDTTLRSLVSFIECYDLVDFVFSGINEDSDTEMKAFDNKIKSDEELKKIYLLYMKNRPDLSSLSSGEGVALNIQLSYYLFLQDPIKRKIIIRNLL